MLSILLFLATAVAKEEACAAVTDVVAAAAAVADNDIVVDDGISNGDGDARGQPMRILLLFLLVHRCRCLLL